MKLSDIRGDETFDVIAELVVPVANIAVDKEASELFSRKPLPAGMTVAEYMAERFKSALPALLKGHKHDLISILATLERRTPEEYIETLSIPSLISGVIEIITDDVFTQLFISAQTGGPEGPSGSAQENTEDSQ